MSSGRNKWAVVLGCTVVAGLALWLTFFRASPEDRIRKTLSELARIVAVKEGDTILSRTARMRSRMRDVVDDDVHVNVAELSLDIRGRKDLQDGAAKAGLVYANADCAFANLTIRVDPGGTLATVDGLALVTASRGGERKVDTRNVHFLLRNADGTWLVTTIDVASPKIAD